MRLSLTILFAFISAALAAQNTPWSTSGSMGIGTTSPNGQLTISAASLNNSIISYRQGPTSQAYVGYGMDGLFRAETMNTDMEIRTQGPNFINFRTSNIDRMRLTTAGFLGVGTNSPRGKIDIWGGLLYVTGTNLDGTAVLSSQSGRAYLGANTMTNGLSIDGSGNVGIGMGTSTPEGRLDISAPGLNNGMLLRSASGFLKFYSPAMGTGSSNQITKAGDAAIVFGTGQQSSGSNANFGFVLAPWHNGNTGLRMDKDGNVGIGTNLTSDVNYKLFVETGIRTRKVRVDQAAWPDYVFESGYNLRTLDELAAFIAANKHLPDVPSAREVETDGIDLGANQSVLLRKIEELTLYTIQQQKKISTQETEIQKLKETLERIEALLTKNAEKP